MGEKGLLFQLFMIIKFSRAVKVLEPSDSAILIGCGYGFYDCNIFLRERILLCFLSRMSVYYLCSLTWMRERFLCSLIILQNAKPIC